VSADSACEQQTLRDSEEAGDDDNVRELVLSGPSAS